MSKKPARKRSAQPVRVDEVEAHRMEAEAYEILVYNTDTHLQEILKRMQPSHTP